MNQHRVVGDFRQVSVQGGGSVQAARLDLAGRCAPYYMDATGRMLETGWVRNRDGSVSSFIRPRRGAVGNVPAPAPAG